MEIRKPTKESTTMKPESDPRLPQWRVVIQRDGRRASPRGPRLFVDRVDAERRAAEVGGIVEAANASTIL